MLARTYRLTRKRDIQKVYKLGKGATAPWLNARALPNRHNRLRIAVVIGKKVSSKAVVRNRLKRLVHQAVHELLADPSFDERVIGQDIVLTLHRAPQSPYSLEQLKPDVMTVISRVTHKGDAQ